MFGLAVHILTSDYYVIIKIVTIFHCAGMLASLGTTSKNHLFYRNYHLVLNAEWIERLLLIWLIWSSIPGQVISKTSEN